ncbi:hypothetical protein VUR80DRAFT_1883 [Thermomyces stellatus]
MGLGISTKYCADGGVYYLYRWDNGNRSPNHGPVPVFADGESIKAVAPKPEVGDIPICSMGSHVGWDSKNPGDGGKGFMAPCYPGILPDKDIYLLRC